MLSQQHEFREHLEFEAERLNLPMPTEEQVEDGFDKLDENDDGKLSPQELKDAMKEYQGKEMLNKADAAFDGFDTNKDGILNMASVD